MASPDKLSIVFLSGEFGRVHYGLVMAAAALAIGKPVTLFFTMEGTRALTPGWADADREEELRAKGLATFAELLDACRELAGTFMVCELGLRDRGLTRSDLRTDITVVEGSAVTFLSGASDRGAMLMV